MRCIRMRKPTSAIAAIGILLPVLACLAACHSGEKTQAEAATVPSAQVAAAQRGDISHVLTLAGQFQPYQVVDVHPKVSGYMRHINVDIGDIVHQGETLAVLEVPELKAQLQQTEFEVQQSQEEIRRAHHEINRAEATHAAVHAEAQRLQDAAKAQPGLIAQQELDDAVARDLSSEAQVDAAKAAMAAAQGHAGAASADHQRVQALHNTPMLLLRSMVSWSGVMPIPALSSRAARIPTIRIFLSSGSRKVRFCAFGSQYPKMMSSTFTLAISSRCASTPLTAPLPAKSFDSLAM